ncbi:MAG: ribosome silencing factor [Bacillota bacterium]
MSPKELKDSIVSVMEDKKASDITVLDIAKQTTIADYFIIATAKNTAQIKALVEAIEKKLESSDMPILRKEGVSEGRWVVVDFGSILVHIFNAETREYYNLEKLWTEKK